MRAAWVAVDHVLSVAHQSRTITVRRDEGIALNSCPVEALCIDVSMYESILAHLMDALPNEGVGLLAVASGAGGQRRVTRFFPGSNIDASPTRYTMNPAEVLAAFRDMRAHGWRLGAIVHSHPSTPPAPSPTDLDEAYYPEALLMIVGLASSPPDVRAWRLTVPAVGRGPSEVPVIVEQTR